MPLATHSLLGPQAQRQRMWLLSFQTIPTLQTLLRSAKWMAMAWLLSATAHMPYQQHMSMSAGPVYRVLSQHIIIVLEYCSKIKM